MDLDTERPGDAVFKHDERTVLLLDEQASESLGAQTLSVDSKGLTLRGGEESN